MINLKMQRAYTLILAVTLPFDLLSIAGWSYTL